MKEKTTLKSILILLGAVVLCIVPFFKINLGVDFTDTGYSIVNFTNALNPDATWSLSTFLSNLTGFFLMKLPGAGTLTGIRAYCTVFVALTALTAYMGLGRIFNRPLVFLGTLIAELLTWCPYVVLYNYLSYFLLTISVLVLYRALSRGKNRLLVIAGVLLGVNSLVRISNVTQAIMILPVIFYGLLEDKKTREILRQCLMCILGFIIGAGFSLLIGIISLGFDAVKDSRDSLFALTGADYGYSFTDMLMTVPIEAGSYIKWLLLIMAAVAVALLAIKLPRESRPGRIISLILGLISLGILLVSLRLMTYWGVFSIHDYTDNNCVRFFVIFWAVTGLITALFTSFSSHKSIGDRFLGTVLICLIFIAPLGTNTGYLAIENNMFLILPLTLGLLMKLLLKEKIQQPAGYVIPAIFGIFLLLTLYQSGRFFTTYIYGSASRAELTAECDRGVLKGTRTLPGLVDIIDGLEDAIDKYGLRNSEVITWGDIPLMSYALEMKSALSTGWPDLRSFSDETFSRELARTDSPVIITNNWFSGGDPLNPEVWPYSDKARMLAEYMNDKSYELIWSNDKFSVYTRR